MIDKKEEIKITEKLGFAMILAMTGGFMDVYSYIVHGKVFATGQTSNLVLVAAEFADKNYIRMLHPIVPIVAFWIGIFTAWHMLYSRSEEKQLLWKRRILASTIFILFITGFIPSFYPDIIANTLVSFAASLQYCAFRKFGTNENYASIFCTGNMRSCADNFYKGIVGKDKQCLEKALRYGYILISFFIGAAAGALISGVLHERAIWIADILLLAALMFSFVYNTDIWKNSFEVKETIKGHMQG